MEDCVEDVEIIRLLIPLKRALCHSRIQGIPIVKKYLSARYIRLKYFETYYIVVFNFSDQGTSRQTENFRNYLTEMSGKGSSPLNCDTCNTKFGFLTRKVIKMIWTFDIDFNKKSHEDIKLQTYLSINFKKSCSECKLYFCSSCIKSMASKKVPDSRYNNGSTGLLKVCARYK